MVPFQESALNAAAPAPGDLRVDLRVRVAGFARRGAYRLALALGLGLPTGDAAAWAGDGAVSLTPRAPFEATWARDFVFAVNVRAAVRPGCRPQGFAPVGVSIPAAPLPGTEARDAGGTGLLLPPVFNAAGVTSPPSSVSLRLLVVVAAAPPFAAWRARCHCCCCCQGVA